ncbi:MAG TPA: ComEC/Rec2 family competence protein [Solirubrobacteraceae bacterium]
MGLVGGEARSEGRRPARRSAARLAREALHAGAAGPRHVLLAAGVAGLLLVRSPGWPVVVVLSAILAAGGMVRRPALGLAAAVALLAGAGAGEARLRAADRPSIRPLLGRAFDAPAYALEPTRERAFGGWAIAARVSAGRWRGVRMVLRGGPRARPPAVHVGDELRARGRVVALAPWERYEAVRGARAALAVEDVRVTGRRRGGLDGAIDGVRRRAEAGLQRGLPAAQAALARGMVLGQDDALDVGSRDEFRASGLSHLLAASGQNVALLALLASGGLAAAGVGLRGRLGGALALVALYVPLAGAGPSIVRAGVMGAAALVAALAGRPGSRAYALLLAAAVTLVIEPRAADDVGWQLSFAAVIAIALLARRWRDALTRRRVPGPLAEASALTAAATVGTAPLLAVHFERLSLVSPAANLLAAPAVAPIVWLGTLAALAAQLPATGALVAILDALAAFPLGFVGWVAHAAASAPHATVAVALGGPIAVVGAYAGLGALVVSRRARALAAGALVAAGLPAAWGRVHPPRAPRDLTVSFLDIGQGDATLVQHGERAILVDTGPPGGPVLQRLRAAGVRRLDLLVLTHAQADHEGAAPAVLDALPVGAVLDGGAGRRSPERAAIEAALRRHLARTVAPEAGEVLRVGPLRLAVLSPPRPPDATTARTGDPNDRAIVARVSEGAFDVLLTADAESPVTLPLGLPAVDVLKVAHHGSADPGLPALLTRLHPQLAAIEVGRQNPYGHPAPATLAALRAVPRVVRTDRDGTVRVTVAGGRMTVRTHA